ncbi:MAG: 30S ribosomal protein S18 [Chlorobi bacterium]|nr:30S ribosomal protein S18 [Chlorobiota bacterium]
MNPRNNRRDQNNLPDGALRQQKRAEPPRRRRNPLRGIEYIDYTNTKLLLRFTNDQGKILPKRITGLTATQQRALTRAVKYARHLALLPFVTDDAR